MEGAALELAKAYLDEGMTTVGAEIHCRHLAPTPVGMKVSATARLRSIERRKMWFDLEVFDEKGKCGEGPTCASWSRPRGFRTKRDNKSKQGAGVTCSLFVERSWRESQKTH